MPVKILEYKQITINDDGVTDRCHHCTTLPLVASCYLAKFGPHSSARRVLIPAKALPVWQLCHGSHEPRDDDVSACKGESEAIRL